MAKVMCNWAPHCENIYCVHRYPHTPYPAPSKNGNPQCEDKGVFCQSESRAVNCVPVHVTRTQHINEVNALRSQNKLK